MERSADEWVELLNAKDVPSGVILTLEEALAQPQVKHRGVLRNVDVPGIGTLPLFGLTALFDRTPGGIETPPPRLSEHTEEVLTSIGVPREQLPELRSRGVI